MEGFLQGLEGYLSASPLLAYIAVFLGGVLTSFTPCVYPMIPITIAYIGGRSGESRLKGLSLSIFYVIGMSATYSALGAFAALTGKLFGAASTNPILYLVVANIFIFLGLSMLDAFTLPIPSFLTSRQPGQKTGGYLGAFLVGLLAGTVAAPCTAPVLGGSLDICGSKTKRLLRCDLTFSLFHRVRNTLNHCRHVCGFDVKFAKDRKVERGNQKDFWLDDVRSRRIFLNNSRKNAGLICIKDK